MVSASSGEWKRVADIITLSRRVSSVKHKPSQLQSCSLCSVLGLWSPPPSHPPQHQLLLLKITILFFLFIPNESQFLYKFLSKMLSKWIPNSESNVLQERLFSTITDSLTSTELHILSFFEYNYVYYECRFTKYFLSGHFWKNWFLAILLRSKIAILLQKRSNMFYSQISWMK